MATVTIEIEISPAGAVYLERLRQDPDSPTLAQLVAQWLEDEAADDVAPLRPNLG